MEDNKAYFWYHKFLLVGNSLFIYLKLKNATISPLGFKFILSSFMILDAIIFFGLQIVMNAFWAMEAARPIAIIQMEAITVRVCLVLSCTTN